jgi:hypothetical protein
MQLTLGTGVSITLSVVYGMSQSWVMVVITLTQ